MDTHYVCALAGERGSSVEGGHQGTGPRGCEPAGRDPQGATAGWRRGEAGLAVVSVSRTEQARRAGHAGGLPGWVCRRTRVTPADLPPFLTPSATG